MAFNGKLLELKTNNVYVEFPLRYIGAESYKITPNQRMESSADRSASGALVRTTVSHTASKIEFSTPIVTNAVVNAINTLLTNAYTDTLQRKLDIRYYNPSTDAYETGTFYIPDIDFEILRIDTLTNVIYYNPINIALIEY